ncbi:MAG: hypothetical protein OXU36_19800, partial [Candidatus Poribacteria bacterium]|nr:hypothetical protein [Candidatus Poribacteria bacterium]
ITELNSETSYRHEPGMNAIEHSNHSHCEARMRVWHSNQRYEVLMHFTGGMKPVWHSPGQKI